MQKYRVLVHGRNLSIEVDGIRGKYGFYTNVYVEAFTSSEAELAALELLQHDARLQESSLNLKDDTLHLSVEETAEIETFDGLKRPFVRSVLGRIQHHAFLGVGLARSIPGALGRRHRRSAFGRSTVRTTASARRSTNGSTSS